MARSGRNDKDLYDRGVRGACMETVVLTQPHWRKANLEKELHNLLVPIWRRYYLFWSVVFTEQLYIILISIGEH